MAAREKEKLISAAEADALIAAHDGDVALYCLYLARHPGADDETAAAVLCRTRGEIAAAREKLGLVLPSKQKDVPPLPADEEGQYSEKEIVSTFREKAFEPILAEMTRILGATPSRAYLNTLVDIYDRLGMPPEVILLLLNYCDAETHRLWGNSRRPTARKISEEAYYWARREIMSIELAEEYIAGRERQREDRHRILELLGIRGREPSPSEGKYLDAWLEMGFSDEAIALAFDRTLTNTGALKWPYMNGILKKWHAAGLHSAEEVEQAEGHRQKKTPPRDRGYGDPVDEDTLADFMGDKR